MTTRFVEDAFLPEFNALLEKLPPMRTRDVVVAARAPASAQRTLTVEVSGRRYDVTLFEKDSNRVFHPLERAASTHAVGGHDEVRAPMQGKILKVLVEQGQEIEAGELICTLEAMKMENHVVAPREGTIAELGVEAGMTVETGALIAVIE